MDPVRSKRKQSRAEKRLAKGLCINVIDGKDCDKNPFQPGGGRGRCPACYTQFSRECLNRSFAEKREIEKTLIEAGTLLDSQEVRSIKRQLAKAAS